jgi:tetratricopeptide (TPR) repeat protein
MRVIHIFTLLINNNKINFKIIIILLLLGLCTSTTTFAQDMAIGLEYLKLKEYTKAKNVFEKLIKAKDESQELHQNYLNCLIQLNDYDTAEKYLKRQIRNQKQNAILHAQLGNIYQAQQNEKESAESYQKAIQIGSETESETKKLAEFLYKNGKTELSTQTIQLGRLKQGNETLASRLMTQIYRNANKKAEMIEEMLVFAEHEANLDYFKAFIQDEINNEKDQQILEKILYQKVQKYPDRSFYTEALVSYLVSQRQFYKAYLQARALDKRQKLDGSNVYDLAMTARQNKDYPNAAKMFEYLSKEYPNSQEYPYYRRFLIGCREETIKTTYPVNQAEILTLIADYDQLLKELGVNTRTVEALKNKAQLQAFYLDQKEKALLTLAEAINLGQADRNFVSRCKLDVGDIQLLMGDFWEATLTYQQVDKAEKDSPIGYDAKLRNAKLNYYKGDFEVAEDFLEILKKATTREIANDAMELNLLIRDNTGQDSTEAAMKCFAAADLLLFQNKLPQAVDSLSHLLVKFKNDDLTDETLYKRATCYLKTANNQAAIADLLRIKDEYPDDVWGDDATYLLAQTYENTQNKEKAMEMYEYILKTYPGSIYVPDSRARYRNLRGDTIN